MQSVNLYHKDLEELFNDLKVKFKLAYDYKKHSLLLFGPSDDIVGSIRLPLHLSFNDDLEIEDDCATIMYLSIESGNAAICVMEGKDNTYHTTFSAYMTRKKQGYSQIKYLNKKGKSRAGSRVRLASTIEFFERINETLSELFDEYLFDRIALDCDPSLISYLHESNTLCPFGKKDDRLYKIPLHIQQSNYSNLYGSIKKLMAPMLFTTSSELMDLPIFQSIDD